MKIAVITGASSGMGREFVYALDRDEEFDELWVIARREERLLALQEKCRAKVRPIVLDLQKRESFAVYRALLQQEQPESTDNQANIVVTVNGEAVELMGKESYIFVDIFDRITFDLTAGRGRAIATLINGEEAEFSQPLHDGDRIDLYWKEN